MRRLVQWIDRLKLVEGVILIGAVWFGNRFAGILGFIIAVAIAMALYTPYCWWRRKGIFGKKADSQTTTTK